MDNHPTGWPLLYEAPLGMICLYGKVMRYTSFWETYFPLPGRYTSQNKVYFISNPASAAYNNSTSRSYQIYESIVPDTHQTDGRRTQTGADGVSLFPPSSSDWSDDPPCTEYSFQFQASCQCRMRRFSETPPSSPSVTTQIGSA